MTLEDQPTLTPSAEQAFDEVRALMRRSEYLKAYDRAISAVALHPDHRGLCHRAVLALARIGAVGRAKRLFLELGLDRVDDDEDVIALWGRLLKDEAQERDGEARRRGLLEAAAVYARAFAATGGYFPAINVASLHLLAGERAAAADWAARAQGLAEAGEDFYACATVAEAALIRGDGAGAAAALARAVVAEGADIASMSTARRQLARIVAATGGDPALLAPLAPPAVAHFCGHRVSPDGEGGRFPVAQMPRVAAEIAECVAANRIGYAYGSLAAGADIMIAEAVLAAGGELEVVLPFDRDEFVEVSVRPTGAEWVPRFERCLDRASGVHFVTEDAYLGDDELFNYASHMAVGLARLRAQMLGGEAHQIAVWDSQASRAGDAAGTAFDVAMGHRIGLVQHLIASRGQDVDLAGIDAQPLPGGAANRLRRTMIFGDLKGFSRLSDAHLPVFVGTVLGVCAEVMARHAGHLQFRNTWGDGLFLVFDDLAAAARCAFDLQAAVAGIDRAAAGLPESLGLRLGMHYGPVFETRDPVLERTNFFGYHVSRAARVEPITPEGEVYVTEQTAAALAVDAPEAFRCEYVGRVPLAKDYGEFPMYMLSRRQTARAGATRPG